MSFAPLKVTLELDGAGLYYDAAEPIHLDSLLVALNARHHVHGEPPARDEAPDEIPIPCARWSSGGAWGWRCSALIPDGPTAEGLVYWRKRFREQYADQIAAASPNLTNGTYRAWNMPLPLLLCHRLVGYAVGDRRALKSLLRHVHALGKKRAHGHGRVTGYTIERVDADYSCERDGLAMRWLPRPDGGRLVRPRPPYWSSVGRLPHGEVGDPVTTEALR